MDFNGLQFPFILWKEIFINNRPFNNKLIIQFGSFSPKEHVLLTVKFPTAFTYCSAVYLTRISTRGGSSYDNEIFPRSWTTTQFTINTEISGGSNWRYLTIGY